MVVEVVEWLETVSYSTGKPWRAASPIAGGPVHAFSRPAGSGRAGAQLKSKARACARNAVRAPSRAACRTEYMSKCLYL